MLATAASQLDGHHLRGPSLDQRFIFSYRGKLKRRKFSKLYRKAKISSHETIFKNPRGFLWADGSVRWNKTSIIFVALNWQEKLAKFI